MRAPTVGTVLGTLTACALALLAATPADANRDDAPLGPPVAGPPAVAPPDTGAHRPAARVMPRLRVTRAVAGLTLPWDVQRIPGGLLVTERDSARLLLHAGGRTRQVADLSDLVWVSGETGLMSIAVDPDFADNRRVFLCHGGTTPSGAHDVRITTAIVKPDLSGLERTQLFLAGLPATSGRHGGCRLLIDRDTGALLVGTGDAAVGTNPQDLTSLGGKVLRLDRHRANPWPTNPWADAADVHQRLLLTSGHRNVQGLAQRDDGSLWSIEHGTSRDDEVNLVKPGGNYGWNPVPGYNEATPMTDNSLPGKQIAARWRSGSPTIATSGAAWVHGARWGRLDGTLAVAALGGERLVFMKFDQRGRLRWTSTPKRLTKQGRLRSVTSLPSGALLVTTSNGSGDAVLKVRPRR